MPDGLLKRVDRAFRPELFVNHYASGPIIQQNPHAGPHAPDAAAWADPDLDPLRLPDAGRGQHDLAADIPTEYDGSKFQMAAPEPNPKRAA